MFDVITIGSATRDVILESDKFVTLSSKKFNNGIGECVALGSKIELDNIIFTTGGGATNAAATFGSLGFQVATIIKIGNDSPGKDVVEDLSRFGVSTKYVRVTKNGGTAYSILLTMKDGERTALVHRGVSRSFTQKDIDWNGCKNTKWIYLTSLGGNFELSKKIIEHANKNSVKIMWNPGSVELESGIKMFSSLLPMVNVLNLNMEEAMNLTKKRTLKEMFKTLHSEGTIRIITDSTNGSFLWKDGEILSAATTGVKAISRTGAGDAFGSGFLSGLIKKGDIKQALAIGTINAESVIQKHGPKNGLLSVWPGLIKINRISIKLL